MRNIITEMLLNAVAMHLVWFYGAAAAFFLLSSPKSRFSYCFLCHDNHACRDPFEAVVKVCRGEYCFKQDISTWGESLNEFNQLTMLNVFGSNTSRRWGLKTRLDNCREQNVFMIIFYCFLYIYHLWHII